MTVPLVSVVIPTYNRGQLLCRALDGVLAQTHRNFFVIVVDDGSTDGTERLVRERYAGVEQIHYTRRANSGVSATRNFALTQLKGEYVAFLDSDDIWRPWKIELQLACFRKLPSVGMIWTNMDAVDSSGSVTEASCMRTSYDGYRAFRDEQIFQHTEALTTLLPEMMDPGKNTQVYWGDVFPCMAMGNLCQPSTVMLTRERANRIGGFDESMLSGEDHAYHLNAARAGDCALIDTAAISYRKGGDDQLTRPEYRLLIAKNFLRTIVPVIRDEKHRLRLPKATLRTRLADAHSWVATECLEHSDNRAARYHCLRSLANRPLQPKVAAMFLAVSVPPRMTARIRQGFRRIKRGVGQH